MTIHNIIPDKSTTGYLAVGVPGNSNLALKQHAKNMER